ncbi:InlB B-repeat-containing protein [Gemmiger sp.]|uniref:InlB B-repeat-containing protein n=1 Tax=Gemmiger sp. TaxID=2049027 RepID=UPI003A941676
MLALVFALGATPLAVYADEAQTGISTVSEDPEEKDKDNTNKNPEEKDKDNTDESSEGKDNTDESSEGKDKDKTNEDTEEKDKDKTNENSAGKDNGSTNDGSEADAPESEEKVAATNGVTPPSADTLGIGGIWNSRSSSFYKDLESATKEAQSGDTLYLGEGNYTLYGIDSKETTKGKDLTFVGSGVDVTAWNIGAPVPDPANYGTEDNGDYSFDGAGTVTFKNMTLRSGSVDYLGFIRADNTVVDNCTINGKTFYWGYTSATFKNTTFNAPTAGWAGDYALWTYSSPVMTFDSCTFNGKGKIINVYTDFGAGKNDITVNFNDCTVNANFSTTASLYKTALNINDSNMGEYKYILNITNANVTAARDKVTCSQVFGFGGKTASNSGRTDVKLDGELVFSAGKKLTHSYTDGEHDQAYNYTGDWSAWTRTEGDEHLLYRTRTRTKICDYCNHSETLPEEREEKREYLLHYDLNGGTPAEGVDYSDHYYFKPKDGNTATVAADPSRAGYQFAGWQDEGGNQYAAGNTVTVDHNITLTAQWNKLVTVSFDLCGHGGTNISSQTFVSGNKASEPTAPKEDGWVFGGWYTEKGCKYRFSFDSAVTSDITLYAKWDRVTTVVSAPVATPTPSPAPAAAATKTATVKNAAIPQTSDVFPMEGLLALLAVGAVGFGAAGWLRKKHH